MGVKESEKINIHEANISLILNSYNGIFSDFDPRDYSERALSVDFIDECKRAIREEKGRAELRLLLPKSKRNLKDELKIKRRIKEHFNYNLKEERSSRNKLRAEGFLWFLLGSLVMVVSTLLVGKTSFVLRFLEIMSIPAGWFLFWEGLGKILIKSKEEMFNYTFYKKMSEVNIIFADY